MVKQASKPLKVCMCSHSIQRHYGLWSYCKEADCDCKKFVLAGTVSGIPQPDWDR